MELTDRAREGQEPREIAAACLGDPASAIPLLEPLFSRIFTAKIIMNQRPAESEDSMLHWSWDRWEVIADRKRSGCGEKIYHLFVSLPDLSGWSPEARAAQGSRVRLATYFGGDRCNAPGKWNGWSSR